MQQLIIENLGWGSEVKAFSWGMIVGLKEREQASFGNRGKVGFSRQASAHPTDGVFNAALLPRSVGIAEKGSHRQPMEPVVVSELGAVIERDRLTKGWRQRGEQMTQLGSHRGRSLIRLAREHQ